MKKNKIFVLTLFFLLTGQIVGLAGLVPDGEKTTLEFWLQNTPDAEKIILNRQEIELMNEKIRKNSFSLKDIFLIQRQISCGRHLLTTVSPTAGAE